MAYQFNAFAQVAVGKKLQQIPLTAQSPEFVLLKNDLHTPHSTHKTLTLFYKGQPKANVKAKLYLPSGETKEIISNAKGVYTVELKEQGIYYIEASIYHKEMTGKTAQQLPYTSFWRCATQQFES